MLPIEDQGYCSAESSISSIAATADIVWPKIVLHIQAKIEAEAQTWSSRKNKYWVMKCKRAENEASKVGNIMMKYL
jgi:hypothetical protein